MGSETGTRVYVVTAITAVVVGFCCLAPHLQAERFTPVLLQPDLSAIGTDTVCVAITGDVEHPGLYTVDSDTALADLLALTGAGIDSPSVTLAVTIGPSSAGSPAQKVNINLAEAWLLEALPGIGPDKAQAIVDFRLQHGDFTHTEELMLVPGIGSTIFDNLKDCVTVTG
ncbi:MAG: ComEA family DNA-binding protein [Dehalococcoidia bacterium]|jgi:competence protein ComEA|nr:ComEA family DNA-binding protein [Dehalococcoidia bacterium]